LTILVAGVLVWTLCLASPSMAQTGRLAAGAKIPISTTEYIGTKKTNRRLYQGGVDQDVMGGRRQFLLPPGWGGALVVRRTSKNQLTLDRDSVMINGQRYGVETEETTVTADRQNEGIGANKRTGEFLGGGAVLGAIIGALAGGGKGAAIGAGAGA